MSWVQETKNMLKDLTAAYGIHISHQEIQEKPLGKCDILILNVSSKKGAQIICKALYKRNFQEVTIRKRGHPPYEQYIMTADKPH